MPQSNTTTSTPPQGFKGTQVRDDGTGPMLIAHRQRLAVVTGPDRGLEREFTSNRISIGSSPGNDLVLTDITVSRRHCEIAVNQERYVIRDLGSTNGTRVAGTPVVEAFLAPGSRIHVGDTEIVFEPKKKWERIRESESDHFGELYGTSAAMKTVFGLLGKVSPTDLSCVVVGETGTGKELAARSIHAASPRASKPFVVVDCGAISGNLIESELFGHEKGAFTGADRLRQGAFEVADGGTVFLDEIGELPIELQPKLLRVLERRELKRLGATNTLRVDVRVIAATHRDLPAMVEEKKFREDVYFRLAEVVVELPSLRSRREDIPLFVKRIIDEQAARGGRVHGVDEEAMKELMARKWPGNVRELRNVIRRVAAFSAGPTLSLQDLLSSGNRESLPPPIPGAGDIAGGASASADVGERLPIKEARDQWVSPMEKEYLQRLIQRCNGNLDLAAQQAGLHRKSLERLLRQHNIKVSAKK